MLDESEFAELQAAYRECMEDAQNHRLAHGATLSDTPIDALFAPVRALYEHLTGYSAVDHNAVMHHRLSLYGPPCARCAKPLRTPRASFCAACGEVSSESL